VISPGLVNNAQLAKKKAAMDCIEIQSVERKDAAMMLAQVSLGQQHLFRGAVKNPERETPSEHYSRFGWDGVSPSHRNQALKCSLGNHGHLPLTIQGI